MLEAIPDQWMPLNELIVIRNQNKSNFGIKFIKQEDGSYVDPRRAYRAARNGEGDSDGDGDEVGEDFDEFDANLRRRSRARPVEQLDLATGKVLRWYASQNEAASVMKVNQVGISQCCRGIRKVAYGFGWRASECNTCSTVTTFSRQLLFLVLTAADEADSNAEYLPVPALMEIKKKYESQMNETSVRVVDQIDLATGVVVHRYANIAAAVAALSVSLRQIQKVLQDVLPDAYGYGWRLYEGPDIVDCE